MSDDLLKQIRLQILELEGKISALRVAEGALLKVVGVVNRASGDNPPEVIEGSIKADVLELLADYSDGLAALEVLKMLKVKRVNLLRTSLSPQLSRLKREGRLLYDGGRWKLKRRER
ncbi:MAG: hypothetical protein COA69_01270 [Robiginitomaculum sp.]|nr:MAG: hypothetical protein COA69_01270 [Robiginitomaculum sp.]